jgi:hypothetical protein
MLGDRRKFSGSWKRYYMRFGVARNTTGAKRQAVSTNLTMRVRLNDLLVLVLSFAPPRVCVFGGVGFPLK